MQSSTVPSEAELLEKEIKKLNKIIEKLKFQRDGLAYLHALSNGFSHNLAYNRIKILDKELEDL